LCAQQAASHPLHRIVERQSIQQSPLDPKTESTQGHRPQGQPEEKGRSNNQNYPNYDRHFDLIEGPFWKQIRNGGGQHYHDLQQFGQQKIEQYQRQQNEEAADKGGFQKFYYFFHWKHSISNQLWFVAS